MGRLSNSQSPTHRYFLARRPFVPGWHPHPEKQPRQQVGTEVAENQPLEDLYQQGWRDYLDGFFWEAHTAWEAVWQAYREDAEVSAWCKGLIQLSAACLHLKRGKEDSFKRVGARGLTACLKACDTTVWSWGMDHLTFLTAWQQFLKEPANSPAMRPRPASLPAAFRRRNHPETGLD